MSGDRDAPPEDKKHFARWAFAATVCAAVVTALGGIAVAWINSSGESSKDLVPTSTLPPPPTLSSTTTTTLPPTTTTTLPPTTTTTTTTLPPTTTTTLPPATTSFELLDPASSVWPYGEYFNVPQLGLEEVRGSGCGGSGELGDEVPDGVWNGFIFDIDQSAGRLFIDVTCVYFGESAEPFLAENVGVGSEDFYQINNSDRRRLVPLASGFLLRDAQWIGGKCIDAGPAVEAASNHYTTTHSWLVIEDDHAVFALTACDLGG